MNFDGYRLSGDTCPEPLIMDGFEIQLKRYTSEEGEKKSFCVLSMNTEEGDFKFILLPEEMKKLSEEGLKITQGLPMREEMIPISWDSEKTE